MLSAIALWFSMVYFASSVSSTQAIECQGYAKYTLTFQAEWTSQSHPDFPSTAHFSSIVGCSHKAAYVMWIPGINATEGVQNVAETGSVTALNNEMDIQITSKNAYKRYRVGGFSGGTGSRSIPNIEVNSEYPLASFITMIAPSPDWFVGVHDYNLCNTTTGKWVDSRARDLPPYDAGTDSGLNFKSANKKTNPPENIHLLTNNTEGSFKGDKPVKRFGTFTFVKTFDSNPVIKPSLANTMQQSQTKYQPSETMKSSSVMIEPKKSSTQKVHMENTPSTKPNVPTQTLDPTATITATSSVQMTPTSTTTSAACSVKQFGFIHALFAMILVNLLL